MTILNLGDMITEARRQLDDPITAGDDSAALWKETELTNYANEAINEVVLRTRSLGTSVDVAGFNIFPLGPTDSPWVAIDYRVMRLMRVTWNGKLLNPTSVRKLQSYSLSADWEVETGEPIDFILDQASRQLRVYPIPQVAGTLRFDVRNLPMTPMTDPAHVPEIAPHTLQPAVNWMMYLAYLKNDADTVDDQAAAKFMNLFDRFFGPRPTHRELEFEFRSARTTPRARFEYR